MAPNGIVLTVGICSDNFQVANMRHNALFRRFISALTRGGPGGMPRPIEVHAHDPLRYVGDMLGWLHQVSVHVIFFPLFVVLNLKIYKSQFD